MPNRFRSGQVLIELMLALAVTTLALLAMVGLATKSLSTTGSAKYRAQASTYATAGMEWARQQRMAGWSAFYNLSSTGGTSYCLSDLNWGSGACPTIGNTVYTRTAILKRGVGAIQTVEATVQIAWNEGARNPSTKQTTIFTNY